MSGKSLADAAAYIDIGGSELGGLVLIRDLIRPTAMGELHYRMRIDKGERRLYFYGERNHSQIEKLKQLAENRVHGVEFKFHIVEQEQDEQITIDHYFALEEELEEAQAELERAKRELEESRVEVGLLEDHIREYEKTKPAEEPYQQETQEPKQESTPAVQKTELDPTQHYERTLQYLASVAGDMSLIEEVIQGKRRQSKGPQLEGLIYEFNRLSLNVELEGDNFELTREQLEAAYNEQNIESFRKYKQAKEDAAGIERTLQTLRGLHLSEEVESSSAASLQDNLKRIVEETIPAYEEARNKTVCKAIEILEDIAERKTAFERESKESEEILSEVLENKVVPLYIRSIEHDEEYVVEICLPLTYREPDNTTTLQEIIISESVLGSAVFNLLSETSVDSLEAIKLPHNLSGYRFSLRKKEYSPMQVQELIGLIHASAQESYTHTPFEDLGISVELLTHSVISNQRIKEETNPTPERKRLDDIAVLERILSSLSGELVRLGEINQRMEQEGCTVDRTTLRFLVESSGKATLIGKKWMIGEQP
ncbi:MAG: hypothetical protein H6502_04380 [Candidatus Woesearchaeota archaeon]|nr:MAG: hypothetical protein H6502_04380 [Candidatus Woesearchaeota archaeon]